MTSICGHISEEVGRPGGRKPGTPGGTVKSSYGARSHLGQFQVGGVGALILLLAGSRCSCCCDVMPVWCCCISCWLQ